MSRFRCVVLTAMVALMAAAGVVAYAQADPGGAPGRGGPRAPGRILGLAPGGGLPLARLNLTPAQQDQIRQLRQQARGQNRAAAAQLRAAMEARRKAVATLPVDEGLIRSTTQALADAETTVAVEQATLRSDIFALLTPDQQARVKTLEAARAGRRLGPAPGQ
jgi:periplasmic protein CpxP/Spy